MLTVWQSNRLERLADRLAGVVQDRALSPLTAEIVVVQNAGMKRWLALELAGRLGVCAHVSFPLPAELVWQAFRAVVAGVPAAPAVEAGVATWRLMAILARLEPQARFGPLRRYLGADASDDARAFELARRIADVFAQYLVFRPDWVRAWEEEETAPLANAEARVDEAWQAELWRRLVPPAERDHHFARVRERFHARLRAEERAADGASAAPDARSRAQLELFRPRSTPRPRERGDRPARRADLPTRISLFGIPALPPAILEAFQHLGRRTDVHLFLLNPSRAYWFDIRTHREQLREAERAHPLDPALLHREVGNSLLASLGKQSRDFIASLLADDGEHVRHEELFEVPGADAGREPTLLESLQRDILDLRERGEARRSDADEDRFPPPSAIPPDDGSLQVHVCHGAMREVEVLHDRLLALFDAHPDLEPSDVVVMTPDIERYAPCIEAVFATAPDARRIPYSIADRSLAAEAPLVAAFLAILDLPASRYDANRILDLLEVAAIRRRFDFSPDQVELVQRWVRDTRIRWGVDEHTRERLSLPATREHTWRFGLDRLLLGYAMAGGGAALCEGILPYDDVEGAEARTVGRLSALTDLLFDLERALAEPRPPEEWSDALAELLDRAFLADDAEEPALESIRRALASLAESARAASFRDPVSLDVVKQYLARELATPAGAGRFLAGRLTFCAMVPMRSIPFEVVCLIGMNDGAFPRSHRPPGFDLIARAPRHGDRSRRDDDRYLFLEALLSARRCFYASYVGRSIRDNSEIPPSVLVTELLEAVTRGFVVAGDEGLPAEERARRTLAHFVTEHPLQAFSRRYFEGDPKLFSYAGELCDAAEIAAAGTRAPAPLVTGALPEPREDWRRVDVESFARFFQSPVRAFLESRFAIRLRDARGLVESSEPFALVGLDAYRLRDEVRELLERGEPRDAILRLLRAKSSLPHRGLGEAAFDEIFGESADYVRRLRAVSPSDATARAVVDPLAAGPLELFGTLAGLSRAGRVDGRPASVKSNDRIKAWVRHLVLCALSDRGRLPDGVPPRSLYVGTDATIAFRPVREAGDRLRELAEIYRRGLCEPLPFFPNAATAYVAAGARGENALAAARNAWRGNGEAFAESNDPYVELAFRDTDPIGEAFAELARAIWAPLDEHAEEVP